jgi:sulfofructose kinase
MGSLDVIGVGTNSVDEVVLVTGLLSDAFSSGKARITGRNTFAGGQTATVAGACAGLGLQTAYIGAFGADGRGDFARQTLASLGVATEHCVTSASPNRSAVILVDAEGHRLVLWERSEHLSVPDAALTADALAARVVHVDDDDIDLALRAARAARRGGATVTSDIEHADARVEALISCVTYPIVEQRLLSDLTGEGDVERALRKLRRLNRGMIVATLGVGGSAALDGDRFHAETAFRVPVVDSTGAGDVFRAGFIYGLLQDWPPPRLLRFANAAAAVCCTRLGALASVPSLADVEGLLTMQKSQAGSQTPNRH